MKALASDLSVSDLEQQLRVGAHFPTKEECQTCVLGLFLKRGEANLYKVRRSNSERVECGCVNKQCKMCVRASYKKKAGDWEVKESSLQHSCDRSEQRGRKRGIKTEHIRSFVPAVDSMATASARPRCARWSRKVSAWSSKPRKRWKSPKRDAKIRQLLR